jgi:hypothetical protein
MITPTTSSLRSGVSDPHQETETGSGWGGCEARPFLGAAFDGFFPREREAVNVFPFDFAPDFGEVNGTFNGIFVV